MAKYYITAHATTVETSFVNGEFGNAEFYHQSSIVNADNTKEALTIFLEKELYFEDVEVYQDDEVGIFTDVLTDSEGYQASETKEDQWKVGNMKLFNAHISFEIYELNEITNIN